MIEEVEKILMEKPSLEREFLELTHVADEIGFDTEMLTNSMLMNIAHSLAVIADNLSKRSK